MTPYKSEMLKRCLLLGRASVEILIASLIRDFGSAIVSGSLDNPKSEFDLLVPICSFSRSRSANIHASIILTGISGVIIEQ